jgi:hypothetical protein
MESAQNPKNPANRSGRATLTRYSTLASLEAALGLVDHVNAAPASHQLVVAVATPQGFQGITDFHDTHSGRPRAGGGSVLRCVGRINRGRAAFRQSTLGLGAGRPSAARLGSENDRPTKTDCGEWMASLTGEVQPSRGGALLIQVGYRDTAITGAGDDARQVRPIETRSIENTIRRQ